MGWKQIEKKEVCETDVSQKKRGDDFECLLPQSIKI